MGALRRRPSAPPAPMPPPASRSARIGSAHTRRRIPAACPPPPPLSRLPRSASCAHHTKHCSQQSACCTGQNLYADSASATNATGRFANVAPSSSATVPTIAIARASACTRGSATARSASGTDTFTPSVPL
eukprot:4305874-Pleurochrysis_carterae.AAC.1